MIQRKRAGTNRRLFVPAGTREKNVIASPANSGMTPNKSLAPISQKVRAMPERPVGTSTLSELGRWLKISQKRRALSKAALGKMRTTCWLPRGQCGRVLHTWLGRPVDYPVHRANHIHLRTSRLGRLPHALLMISALSRDELCLRMKWLISKNID